MRKIQKTGLFIIAICLLAVILGVIIWVPDLQVKQVEDSYQANPANSSLDKTKRIELVDNYRKTWVQIFTGLIALIGIFGTLWAALKTQEQAERGKITDRYYKGVEQLGNDKPQVRIGGIYALGQILELPIADEYYWPVMDILAAFIRNSAPNSNAHETEDLTVEETREMRPAADVEAALNVLGRRTRLKRDRTNDAVIDLGGIYLAGAWLVGTHLEESNLIDSHLHGADFTDAKLNNSYMIRTCLKGCILKRADLSGVKMENADLSEADLSEAILSQEQINQAIGDAKTILPDERIRPTIWK